MGLQGDATQQRPAAACRSAPLGPSGTAAHLRSLHPLIHATFAAFAVPGRPRSLCVCVCQIVDGFILRRTNALLSAHLPPKARATAAAAATLSAYAAARYHSPPLAPILNPPNCFSSPPPLTGD